MVLNEAGSNPQRTTKYECHVSIRCLSHDRQTLYAGRFNTVVDLAILDRAKPHLTIQHIQNSPYLQTAVNVCEMQYDAPTPLILFPGLAADANIFAPQKLAFPQLVVPAWPIPGNDDTLETYCHRIADDLQPLGPAVIGGASFGGIIALHIAQRLNPLAVILIGSVRSPDQLPRIVKLERISFKCSGSRSGGSSCGIGVRGSGRAIGRRGSKVPRPSFQLHFE